MKTRQQNTRHGTSTCQQK